MNSRLRAAPTPATAGPQPLADLGLDARDWFSGAVHEGDEEVAGVETARLRADVRADRIVEGLRALAGRIGLGQAGGTPAPLTPPQAKAVNRGARDGTIEAWVGIDDGVVRRLRLETDFAVPHELRAELDGASGGYVFLELTQEEVGEEHEITIPEGGGFKPIGSLLDSLDDLSSGAFALGLD